MFFSSVQTTAGEERSEKYYNMGLNLMSCYWSSRDASLQMGLGDLPELPLISTLQRSILWRKLMFGGWALLSPQPDIFIGEGGMSRVLVRPSLFIYFIIYLSILHYLCINILLKVDDMFIELSQNPEATKFNSACKLLQKYAYR